MFGHDCGFRERHCDPRAALRLLIVPMLRASVAQSSLMQSQSSLLWFSDLPLTALVVAEI